MNTDWISHGFVVCVVSLCVHVSVAETPTSNCKAPPGVERKLASSPSSEAYAALGGYFGEHNEYPCAIPAFRKSLRLNPKSWQTRSYLGLALLESGDAKNAASELRISLQQNPHQQETRLALGAALTQMNQVDAAIAEFRAVLKANPKAITAFDWLSKALISQARYATAIDLLKTAPPDEVLQMDMVVAYSKSRRQQDAIRLLQQMMKDRPLSAVSHAGLATIYSQLDRWEESAAEFREALWLNPQDDESRVSYAKVLILIADFKAALPVVQHYRQRHPDDFDGLYMLGVVDRKLGNLAEAKDMLSRAASVNPEHFYAHYNLGVTLMDLGEMQEARWQLEKALQLDPASIEARFRLANALRSLGLQDEARQQMAIYQRNVEERKSKDMAESKANQGNQSLTEGDTEKAVEAYREAVAANPKDSHIIYNLALALDRKGDYLAEQEVLQQAIAVDPEFALAHNQIGFLFFQTGQMDEAEKEFKTAISLDPHYAEAQNNLGSLYGRQGKDAEAERLLRQALENNPGYAQALVNLGVTLASQSRFSEAESALQDALKIEPDNEQALVVRSEIQAARHAKH